MPERLTALKTIIVTGMSAAQKRNLFTFLKHISDGELKLLGLMWSDENHIEIRVEAT